MPTLDRVPLAHLSDAALAAEWQEVAFLLHTHRAHRGGPLGQAIDERHRRVKAEYARRGVQLHLFD